MNDRAPSNEPRRALLWISFAALAIAFAAIRMAVLREYVFARFADLIAGTCPLPFGHRVLVPVLARPLVAAGLSPTIAFVVLEAGAAFAVLAAAFAATPATVIARRRIAVPLVVLGGLALASLLPTRWPVFYPWDTPAAAIMLVAIACAQRQRWDLAVVVAAVGAANRESAILVPAIMLAYGLQTETDRRGLLAAVLGAVGAVVFVRTLVGIAWPNSPGPPMHFTISGHYRLFENAAWLASPRHVSAWLSWGGWALLSWPLVWRRSTWPERRLGALAVATAAGLLWVANVYEPRAFGEPIVIATWIVVVAWGRAHAHGEEDARPRWLARLDAATLPLLATVFFVAAWLLSRYAFLPVAQWPMP